MRYDFVDRGARLLDEPNSTIPYETNGALPHLSKAEQLNSTRPFYREHAFDRPASRSFQRTTSRWRKEITQTARTDKAPQEPERQAAAHHLWLLTRAVDPNRWRVLCCHPHKAMRDFFSPETQPLRGGLPEIMRPLRAAVPTRGR